MTPLKIVYFCLLAISMVNGVCSMPTGHNSGSDILNIIGPRNNCSSVRLCDLHHYELALTATEINRFPKEPISCYLNKNQQIRYYICRKCSVCEPLSAVLLECGRKHDTICSNHSKVESRGTVASSIKSLSTLTIEETIPVDANTENKDSKRSLYIIVTVGVVFPNVILVYFYITLRRWKRLFKRICATAKLTNESTVSVIPASSERTSVGVTTTCNVSLGGTATTPMTMITSTKKTSYNPFWLEMKATIGPEGGVVSDPRSGVNLIIPPGAIPETHPKQEIIVRVALKPSNFGLNQQKDLTLLGPVVECLSPGLAEFNSNVTLVVPHRAKLNPDWKFQVLHSEDKYSDPVSKFRWTVTSSNHDAKHGVHFEVDENFFRIKTSHFTTYTCAGSCSRKAPLNLQVVVYGDYVHIDGRKQTVDLRCYVCDTIKDYSHTFRVNERNGPLCVPRPINHFFDKKTKKIELFFPEDDFGTDFQWTSETFNDSLPNSRVIINIDQSPLTPIINTSMINTSMTNTSMINTSMINTIMINTIMINTIMINNIMMNTIMMNTSMINTKISLKHVARCCSEAIPHYEAFTLKPKDEGTRVDSLEMTLKIVANGLTEIIGPIRMITMDTGRSQSPANYTDIVSNETLREISREIPRDKWKDVYRTLHDFAKFEGSANIDIENIEHNNQSEMGEMKYQVLMLWRTKAGRQATKTALTQALRSCQLNSIADDCIKLESTI
ncbi:uncharacterized protein [Antedon mediterranea]|uniref:uncharacterized protein n=1 Tax=Antedon mediterranea TaxID=105859 RepID=UPI003AF5CA7F